MGGHFTDQGMDHLNTLAVFKRFQELIVNSIASLILLREGLPVK
jgi:hypothetical protein